MQEHRVGPDVPFGRLTVVEEAERDRHGHRCWRCRCICGNETVVAQPNLVSGAQQSCGCLRDEIRARRHTKHGHAHSGAVSPEYSVWLVMKDRCLNPRSRGFRNYGGRGITVCDEWRDSFEAFYRDMGPRKSPAHSLERKDNNGPYAPWNCEWATRVEQAANTRRNHYVMLDGERLHISEAARRSGISEKTIHSRRRLGWPESDWFIPADPRRTDTRTPKTGRPPETFVTYRGERVPLAKAAAAAGLERATVKERIERGWPEEDWFLPAGARGRGGGRRAKA